MPTRWDVEGPDVLADRLKEQEGLKSAYDAARQANEAQLDSDKQSAYGERDAKLASNAPRGVDLNPIEQARADAINADCDGKVKAAESTHDAKEQGLKAAYDKDSEALGKRYDSLQHRMEREVVVVAANDNDPPGPGKGGPSATPAPPGNDGPSGPDKGGAAAVPPSAANENKPVHVVPNALDARVANDFGAPLPPPPPPPPEQSATKALGH